jgi:TonB family protein
VKDVRPEYPAAAQSARVEGAVVLDVIVGADGKVADVKVTRSIPQLDAAAVAAIKQWEFAPTMVNGVAVPVLMTVTENFTLAGAPQVTAPRLMTEVHPEYTTAGRNARIAGEVVLSGWVELDGKVTNIAVVQSLDSKYGLDEQAIKAFSQWRFAPATKDGKPVRARITARLAFTP